VCVCVCVNRSVFVSEVEESLALKDLQPPHENRNGNGQEERNADRLCCTKKCINK